MNGSPETGEGTAPAGSLLAELGVEPLINAATTFTAFGGSLMPREVLDAMEDASRSFVDMHDLHLRAGQELARLTGNEAAYVTSGCAAGIVLAVLACRTGSEPTQIGRLLDRMDFPDEVILHAAHRIPYDPAVQLAGARIRSVGNVLQTFHWELEAAITDRTAAILYVAGSHLPPGALPLADVVEIAKAKQVPVVVDAAAQLPPLENLWHFTRDQGADLALFSGGKALRGPQASGLMVGAAGLVAAARAHGAPHQRLARAMKAGKEEIAGLVAAVRRYTALDHGAQHRQWSVTVGHWQQQLDAIDGVSATVDQRNEAGQPVPRVRIDIDAAATGISAEAVVARLREGRPRVEVLPGGQDTFWIGPDLLQGDEEAIVASAIVALLPEGEPLRQADDLFAPTEGP